MSRSYKHSPVCCCAKTHGMKKIFNSNIRKKKYIGNFSYYKKLNCSWDICDYRSYYSFYKYLRTIESYYKQKAHNVQSTVFYCSLNYYMKSYRRK